MKFLRLLTLFLVYLFIGGGVFFLSLGVGPFLPLWVLPALMALLTLLKLLALGCLGWLVFDPGSAPPPRGEEFEFLIQADGRPVRLNVVPDTLPRFTNAQKLLSGVLLLGGLGGCLQPENFVVAPTYQLWVLETGVPHTGQVIDLHPVESSRQRLRCYLTFLYETPTGQVVRREQEISEALYAQLLTGGVLQLPIRYPAAQPTTGYAVDPQWWVLFARQFSLPLVANLALSGLALVVLWVFAPELWRRSSRQRHADTI